MKDVANEVGCDPSTVSLALRGDPRILPETREKVQRVAKKLGYSIHPMISAWVTTRRSGRPLDELLPLVYLTCHLPGFRWRDFPHFLTVFEGARDRAAMHGFNLTELRFSDYEKNPRRLDQILFTRNVQGVIIGPAGRMHDLPDLKWDRYSLVTIGYGLQSPEIHRVTEDEHLALRCAFESCVDQGYRRVGLAFMGKHNRERRERWVGAYLIAQLSLLTPRNRLPIFDQNSHTTLEDAQPWIQKHKPDFILTDEPEHWIGGDLPFMAFALPEAMPLAGIYENGREVGEGAADMLVSSIMRNERGVPKSRHTLLVEPVVRREE